MTSTDICFEKPSNLEHVHELGWMYCRSFSARQIELQNKMLELYSCKGCIITCSGMAAIACVLNTVIDEFVQTEMTGMPRYRLTQTLENVSIAIVVSTEMYSDTQRLVKHIASSYNNLSESHKCIRVFEFNQDPNCIAESLQLVADAIKDLDARVLVFAETVSNPSGFLLDAVAMRRFSQNISKQKKHPPVVVLDNTWVSHIGIKDPLSAYNAQLVIVSLSKHYSAGQTILGAIVGHKKWTHLCHEQTKRSGMHVDPAACSLVLNTIPLMKFRVRAAHLNALGVELALQRYIKPDTPQCINNIEWCGENEGCTVMLLTVGLGLTDAIEWMKHGIDQKLIAYQTSFGGDNYRFDTFPVAYTRNATFCRLSIGIDQSPDEIVNEMLLSLACIGFV